MEEERKLEALTRALQESEGYGAEDFRRAMAEPPVISVRLNAAKPSSAFQPEEAIPWCPQGRYLPVRPVFTLDPLLHAGAYYVQEASSMFLDWLLRRHLPARKGLRILDLCAAPGGKSTLIAGLLNDDDLLVSNEVIRTRAAVLEENMTRWGLHNTWVSSNDPADFARLPGYFDVMVVDAPCSGSGLWRKDPDAMDEWSEDAVALCAARQKRILADAWPTLREGGLLIYATCSFSPEENEDMLDWLAGNLAAQGLPGDVPPAWGILQTTSPKHGLPGYRFMPGRARGEGFFVAALQKTGGQESFLYPRFRHARDKAATAAIHGLLDERASFVAVEDARRRHHAILPLHEPDLPLLSDVLYLRKTGIELGENKGKDWLPDHAIALAVRRSPLIPNFALDRQEALRFLKKESLAREPEGKGWRIATYEGLGLGWLKALSGRSNNYLPKSWRIRMEVK